MLSEAMKTFWVVFFKDPATGVVTGTAYGHNATADYKHNPYYIGTQEIEVDMERMTKNAKPKIQGLAGIKREGAVIDRFSHEELGAPPKPKKPVHTINMNGCDICGTDAMNCEAIKSLKQREES